MLLQSFTSVVATDTSSALGLFQETAPPAERYKISTGSNGAGAIAVSPDGISWLLPIISFACMAGLGLDYDIFLLSRIPVRAVQPPHKLRVKFTYRTVLSYRPDYPAGAAP